MQTPQKKLLLITDLYPNKFNPVNGVFVQKQAIELSKFYQIQVVAACDKNPFIIYQHHQDGFDAKIICYPYWQKFFLSSLITYRILALPVIKRCYKRFKPDIIHIHDYRHIPELFWLKPWLNKLPIPKYLTLHNIRTHPAFLMNNPRIKFYKWALGRTLTRWNHIFTVNSRLAEWAKPYNQKVTVIGNGITEPISVEPALIDNFKKKLYDDYFKIISIGNLVTDKGFSYLIEAVSILKKEGFLIQLLIVGEGEKRNDIERKVHSCDVAKEVTLSGRIDNAFLRNTLPLFDLFVLPSYSETFGIVFLESMFAGLPVIGIRNEGIYGLAKDGAEALFAEPKSSKDLADKIKLLINNPVLKEEMAKAGQILVKEKYMLSELIQRVIKVYEQK
ncbi:MAG: glycosyltransferase family 4 protein [Candidatus Cloacimonas sp.]